MKRWPKSDVRPKSSVTTAQKKIFVKFSFHFCFSPYVSKARPQDPVHWLGDEEIEYYSGLAP